MAKTNNDSAPVFEQTEMFKEAGQAPEVIARQLQDNQELMNQLAKRLSGFPPKAVVTCARGSSDHAATFAKYLIETKAKVLTSSAAPSVSSVYSVQQDLAQVLFLAISQSGKSPDLIATVTAAKQAGAYVVAMVNVPDSPLAESADLFIPLHAGPETSVAATKSYIATLSAVLQLVTTWTQDRQILQDLHELPPLLARAWELDWQPAVMELLKATNLFVVARGTGFGIAQEAALKFKETCGLHAEALSAAEIRHGPMAIVNKTFPVFVFSQNDPTRSDIDGLIHDFSKRQASVLLAGPNHPDAVNLPVLETKHPEFEPLLFAQSFYRMVNQLAVMRGYDPDRPPHLQKVTETL